MKTFLDFWLSEETLSILEAKWFTSPSSIQEKTFPLLLNNRKDIIWQSQTWTWKTAAFGIPIVENLLKKSEWRHIKAVVLCPTRELAIQVWNEIDSFVWKRKLDVFTIYWWQSYIKERKKIKSWIDILVWTPGRIIDHLKNKVLDFSKIEYFVLDEADEMLNMWFIDDIKEILETTPDNKNTVLFSATMPDTIMKIAKQYMKDYEIVKVKSKSLTNESVEQFFYTVRREDKAELLSRILDIEFDFYWIIFCRTKADVDELTKTIKEKWYNVDAIHWDISQNQREKVISTFKKWSLKILVATDVAARWLDVNNLTHVVNFAIPDNIEDYTHRIWRTGRAWKTGVAISFVTPSEKFKIWNIVRRTKAEITEKQIPDVDFILSQQREKLKENIWTLIDNHQFEDNIDLAKELLKLDKSEIIVSSLIKLTLNERFSADRYWKISPVRWRWDRFDRSDRWDRFDRNSRDRNRWSRRNEWMDDEWNVRLFIALWKSKWMNPRKLIDHISDWSWVPQRNIDDLQLLNDFSFITVSPNDADKIIRAFNKKWDWGKPLISRAKKIK